VENNGWNVVSLANNHAMDYGNEGLEHTMRSFKNAHLFGAGSWEEAYKPLIFTASGGSKIGIIACSHREFGCLYDEYSQKNCFGYAWICHPRIDKMIIETRNQVDALFIYAHAGVEELEQPLPEWRTLYKHFIDLGCDGVIASHPHIPMGSEIYKGKPIYYSLGNFCFQKGSYDNVGNYWLNSIMVELTVDDNKNVIVSEHLVVYAPMSNCINADCSADSKAHILDMNKCLADSVEYMTFINEKVVEMWPWYQKLFEWSGFVPIPNITELPLKYQLKNKILGRHTHRNDYTSKTHLLNNLQCESHRWTIQRALNLIYNIG
jgi:poly-gamma-glutamate synthesis protein (capsule biosynthesis protein)